MVHKSQQHIDQFVDDYLHGVLYDDDVARLEEHCETCTRCQALLEEGRARKSLLTSTPPTEASEKLVERTTQRIQQDISRRSRRWRILVGTVTTLTTAAVLLIGAFHIYSATARPTPYDVRILGQEDWLEGSYASIRVAVYDRDNGQPMAGVPVELSLQTEEKIVQLVRFETSGATLRSPRFEVPEGGGNKLIVTAFPQGSAKGEKITKSIKTRRDWKLMLSTDKPVYQPGQTIHMRAIGLQRPHLEPMAGQQATFSVTDPKGNVIFRQSDVSSKFGIVSADCPMATEIIEGDYELRCEIGETATTRSVKVEKYVLPKFKIVVSCERPFYAPQAEVVGSVQADYFFGEPVAGGEVKLQAFTNDIEPVLIHAETVKTDPTGKTDFRFRLPSTLFGREQTGGNAEFQLFATVTDSAGQSYSAGIKRLVTAQPLRVEIIPESGTLVKNVANRVFVYTSTADGRPTATRLVISGVTEEVTTNELGVASFEVTPQESRVSLTVKATGLADTTLVSRKTERLVCGGVGDYLLRPDKAVYDGGETMQLTGHGGGVEPIFVDLLKDGQCVLSETVEMQDGTGTLELDLPADLFGTIRMVTYRFGKSGLPYRKSRTLFVRQAGEINIDATLDRDSYRPGETATLKIQLTDADGQPKPGAVSLAAVDEAVFSVLNQSAGVERVFFLLEKELLQPVYTIYPWVPASLEGKDANRDLVDNAFLSLTSDVAAGPSAVPTRFTGEMTETNNGEESEEPMLLTSDESSPFTLKAASYRGKVRGFKRWQKSNLRLATQSWWWLAGSLAFTMCVTFVVYRPKAALITAAVAVLGMPLICLATYFAAPAALREVADTNVAMTSDGAEWDGPMDMAMPMAVAPSGMEGGMDDPMMPDETAPGAKAKPPRLREYFPETLLWRPELVTDETGKAEIEISLADSITTWRLSASAVAAGGQLGSLEKPIKVFQPFFVDLDLPVSLTRGDEATVPLVVYNYLDQPQTVTLEIADADWFERIDAQSAAQGERPPEPRTTTPAEDVQLSLELAAGEVRSLGLPIRVLGVGTHTLQVTATSGDAADAIKRQIDVVPNGRMVEEVVSGNLNDPVELSLLLPTGIVPGSDQAFVKLYPSTFSQLLEGLDSIFRMPYGCFEQTSSTTYPNVLALEYLRENDLNKPVIEAKARQYIHLGYQRLLSFEINGGGFDWYGQPPAKLTLTAYGLMEFQDMARVHDIDPQLLQRTRSWLLSRRQGDGSWTAPGDHFGTVGRVNNSALAKTAYVAWSVFAEDKSDGTATLEFLLRHEPGSIDDPYLLALVIHAIHAIDPEHSSLAEYSQRLNSLRKTDDEKDLCWWEQDQEEQTMFYGSGRGGDCETTALAALAFIKIKKHTASTRGALTWLVSQKDANGTWYSTQATVLALKALIAGSGSALGEDKDRRIDLAWNGESLAPMAIPLDQADVMQLRDISANLSPGENRLALNEPTNTGTAYQVVFRYYVEDEDVEQDKEEPLSIDIAYDRQRLEVDQHVTAVATVRNNMDEMAPMVMLDLPIPGGFRAEADDFVELQGSKKIAKFQITARQVIVYLLRLRPGEELKLNYRLRATMPVDVTAPAGQVYEYYDPDTRGASATSSLKVTAAMLPGAEVGA